MDNNFGPNFQMKNLAQKGVNLDQKGAKTK